MNLDLVRLFQAYYLNASESIKFTANNVISLGMGQSIYCVIEMEFGDLGYRLKQRCVVSVLGRGLLNDRKS